MTRRLEALYQAILEYYRVRDEVLKDPNLSEQEKITRMRAAFLAIGEAESKQQATITSHKAVVRLALAAALIVLVVMALYLLQNGIQAGVS